MLNRRSFLALSGAVLGAPSWATLTQSSSSGSALFASAYSLGTQSHHFGLFDEQGRFIWTTPLTDRAHAPVIHPNQSIVGIVARRPGFFIDFFDVSSHQRIQRIEPQHEHHFYGHALFTKNGKALITQENHYPTGQGKIVVRDWPSGQVVATFSSNGIGPHEAIFLNQHVLVIANGGLKTHPDEERTILNLSTMKPNVTYLHLVDGRILNESFHPDEWHKLSIRHLDVNAEGTVALGFQYQGDIRDQVPLVGLSRLGQTTLQYLTPPEAIRVRFKQYCGSVCFDSTGDVLAVSTPKGGLVAFWHLASNTFLGIENCRDVCGLIATNNAYEFLVTSGTGAQRLTNPVSKNSRLVKKHIDIQWDNHLKRINV
ncbi:DUF1513 domain-containing protein [Marinomonas sp. IMCC 4694]|uniref:DUF1513 domain-containing protein n=1 Tax=Marinomonas sp. IMCC 4694 TaxID=2605432 RepID=UPI0011E6A90B|nr:DUF1513 domain-containing protein [Marinomonas sp. IMCC 4694]TYL47706.1 DUF1513 domain-containing protein [Marinomonas sp. IMCC 4694]